ncbi:hypothetical protein EYF80_010155 [Liparis tanakae]|uniref:Transmembrane protein n=1 Tax=Liparis tanakae TaxID=230148 RepID=A0A4Z2IQW9_9TELE|nr:hypothetical protein EYF80_010155 [Liparis tanakae]
MKLSGLLVVRAGDCVLADSFREDGVLSRGFFPLAGDLRLASEDEDLDLPTFIRERPSEPAGFKDAFAAGFGASAAAVCEDAAASPVFPGSPPPPSPSRPLCLLVFLPSRALFPRSADRRRSRCRRALLKKDSPFSSGLAAPPRCRLDTLGERRLATEELLLELLTERLSGRTPPPPPSAGEERATELPRRPPTSGLACAESRLQLLSTRRRRPPAELFSGTPAALCLAVGDGEAEDAERTSGLRCGVAGCAASLALEGVPQGVAGLLLALALLSFAAFAFLPFPGVPGGVSAAAQLLLAEHNRFLADFSGSALPAPLEEAELSGFGANPPRLLLRFCSLGGGAWAGAAFWSIAAAWLLFSVASFLAPFFSALQYITSRNLEPSSPAPPPSAAGTGVRPPK